MIRDRVQQTSTTAGTGTINLDGPAPSGYLAFASVFANSDKVYYCVIDGASWEIIEGVFATGAPPTLTRVRTLASSNGGSPVSFSGAAKQVFSDAPAELLGAMGGRLKAATTTNVSNAFSVTLPVPVAGPTLVDHMEFSARINAANTGAVTLAVNGGTAKNVRKYNNLPLISGDWRANLIGDFRYDLVNDIYVWMNPPEKGGIKVVSGTTYTVLAEDYGVLLVFTSATGCAVTLPQATGSFVMPWWTEMQNAGAGSLVITPTTSTIDGAASLTLAPSGGAEIRSDSVNYRTRRDGGGAFSLPVTAKAITYTMLAADKGSEVNFTTAGVTFNLLAAATVGSGGTIAVRNSAATGDVTIDPNGAETLDGLATRLLRPGDWVLLRTDGTNWRTIGGDYSWTSSEITITAAAVSTNAHGLGGIPDRIKVVLRCKTAEMGYAVGDEIEVAYAFYNGYESNNVQVWTNATNFNAVQSATRWVIDVASTGVMTFLTTPANWKLVLKAWRK